MAEVILRHNDALESLVRPSVSRARAPRFRVPRLARRLVGPVLVLAAWQALCDAHVFSSFELASPLAVIDAGRELWADGTLQTAMAVSLERVVAGLAIGVAAGVTLAVITGLFWLGEDLLDPVLQAARAVPILGLDEPFGVLDALTRSRMHLLLQELCARHHPAVLLVTHDVQEAIVLADRVLVLTDGLIGYSARVQLDRPRDPGEPGFLDLRSRLLAELGVPARAA